MKEFEVEIENIRDFGVDSIFFDVTIIIDENVNFKTTSCKYNFFTDEVTFYDDEFENNLKDFEFTIEDARGMVYHYIKTNDIQKEKPFDILNIDFI